MPSVFDIGYCCPLPQDEPDDLPIPGRELIALPGPLELPSVVYGAAALCDYYNSNEILSTTKPLRTIRLALRYGIRAFDTSVYYGKSEILLGNILKALESEFPRSSYQLVMVYNPAWSVLTDNDEQMTKCGRYGPQLFDYSQKNIRESVMNSLRRLQTDYLDTVYLHDVEFVCTPVSPRTSGNHTSALNADAKQYGLADEDKGTIRGPGDQKILDAISELRKLQDEGIIKHIGITGYPLPTLLRLAILALYHPPYKPLDVVLSYCHLTLQNLTFIEFSSHFETRARIGQLVTASPLSMGLLTATVPKWHPAPVELRRIVEEFRLRCPMDLPDLALGFSIRHTRMLHHDIPLVVGLSTPREVHQCIKVWREMQGKGNLDEREIWENVMIKQFEDAGFKNWSWA